VGHALRFAESQHLLLMMLLLPWRHSGNAYMSRQCLKRRGTQLLTATSFIWGTLWRQLIIT